MIERADAALLVTPRRSNTHKGTYGHPLIIAGGRGKAGAAILTSRGALRTGAGLVTAAIPECVASIVAAGQAELMTEPMPQREGHFDGPATIESLAKLVSDKSSLIVGPGIGVSDDTKLLLEWLVKEGAQPSRPLLIDADGLNVLAILGPAILKSANGPVAITPHPGEMARLLKSGTAAVNANRIGAARQFAEATGAAVLLKGARTIVAAPGDAVSINSSGNPGMATPGMGDALSGIIGALLRQGMATGDALRLGAFVHGFAADNLAARLGPVGYLAGDVVEEMPRALSALMP
jgi:ADP-dependent NAD(P)H-hydrate dehydratase / NAD(P)H-hydrate epimerase